MHAFLPGEWKETASQKRAPLCSWEIEAAVWPWAIKRSSPTTFPKLPSHSECHTPILHLTNPWHCNTSLGPYYAPSSPVHFFLIKLNFSAAYILHLWIRGSFMIAYFSIQMSFKRKDCAFLNFIHWKHSQLPKCNGKQAGGVSISYDSNYLQALFLLQKGHRRPQRHTRPSRIRCILSLPLVLSEQRWLCLPSQWPLEFHLLPLGCMWPDTVSLFPVPHSKIISWMMWLGQKLLSLLGSL